MGAVPGSRDTGPWTPEDDPDFEKGSSLTSAPGRVPDEDDEESSGRTGKELNQETLMIDGKQYRRISEDVEKESKLNEALPSWYKDGAKLVKQVMKKNRIKPISGGGMMSSWSSIARKIRSGQEFAYSIKPSHEFAELYHSSLDQNSKKISILAKKLVKDIEKAGMAASFDGDFSIHYRSQDIAESIYEFSEFYKRFKK